VTRPKCTGKDGACRWRAWSDEATLCLNCASAAGDEGAVAEQRRRAELGRAAKERTRKPRSRVPLDTPHAIRAYIEQLAALVESAGGDKVARAKAGAALAAQAHELFKSDVERQAREIDELLKANPELRRAFEKRQLVAVSK
jgi:hypothetical protein